MGKITLFELKEKMTTLQEAINVDAEWIAEKAADPATSMDEINAKKAHRDEMVSRYEMLKAQHDELEAKQRKSVKKENEKAEKNEKDAVVKAKAEFYRSVLTGGDIRKAYEGLGALPAGSEDLGSGDNLLPTNLSNELIVEPNEENSLRQVEPVSNITGLEEPKLLFNIEDEDLADVTDKETAREIKMEGDTVTYGRYKTKVMATIKDSMLHGADVDLINAVEGALQSGIAVKEKIRAFAPAKGAGAYDEAHAHMSFYAEDSDGNTLIKSVEAGNLIDAIIKAWADLPDAFANNAVCVMRKSDYYAAIRELNGSGNDLWGKKPEDVIGIRTIFNDRAIVPVIGDFRFSKQNYENGTIFDRDKDVKKGEYYFVITVWGDHQIRLKSAFRLAKVNP